MKNYLLTLSFMICTIFAVNAQIVINEILPSVPGSGEDEEFIELHNTTSASINLQGYIFRDASASYTLGNVSIAANGFFIIARDSVVFTTSFGIVPDADWNGFLSTSEYLVLEDNTGSVIDSVNYASNAPWPTIPTSGNSGYSLQLCDASTDNNVASNWGTSQDSAGYNNQATTVILYCTPGAANNCFTPPAASYPVYSIADIDGVDAATGNADSTNVTCELRGIACCTDFRFTGYDFPFANSDNSAGVRIFSTSDISNYQFAEGDSLHISGTVSQYNGLLQFQPDSIALISSGNNTPSPMIVTVLDESTENKYLTLENVYLADTSQWTGTGTGFNVDVTNGTDTFLVRIDNETDLFNMPAPLGTFDLNGWGSQFDGSAPRTEGYQLMPCSSNMVLSEAFVAAEQFELNVYPNPTSGLLNIESDLAIKSVQMYNTIGQLSKIMTDVQSNNLQIEVSDLAKGLYMLAIETDKGLTTQQVIVE